MGVVEAPVQHPDEHAVTMKRLGQIEPGVNAVHARAVSRFVDVRDRPGGQFYQGHGQLRNHIQGIGVHPEGGNAGAARTRIHSRMVCGPGSPFRFRNVIVQAPNEAHGGTALNEGHGMALCHIHERLGRGVGGCEFDELAQGELVWGGQGLGPGRKKCTAQGGQEEDT